MGATFQNLLKILIILLNRLQISEELYVGKCLAKAPVTCLKLPIQVNNKQ